VSTVIMLCTRGCGNPASWFYHERWTCDACYRAEEFRPGHVRTGVSLHFLGRCHDCDVQYMAFMTLDQADNWYRQGVLDQDEYEAYCHVWATSVYRYSSTGSWRKSPVIPEVVRLVAILRGVHALRVTAKRRGTS
jgi:hypothetical protein